MVSETVLSCFAHGNHLPLCIVSSYSLHSYLYIRQHTKKPARVCIYIDRQIDRQIDRYRTHLPQKGYTYCLITVSIQEEFASGTFKHAKAEAFIMKSLTEILLFPSNICKGKKSLQFLKFSSQRLKLYNLEKVGGDGYTNVLR